MHKCPEGMEDMGFSALVVLVALVGLVALVDYSVCRGGCLVVQVTDFHSSPNNLFSSCSDQYQTINGLFSNVYWSCSGWTIPGGGDRGKKCATATTEALEKLMLVLKERGEQIESAQNRGAGTGKSS